MTITRTKETNSWERVRASDYSSALLERADPRDLSSVQAWEAAALASLSHAQSASQATSESIMQLFDASIYYESIGYFKESLNVVNEILAFANGEKSYALQARAHNILAGCYSRICDFNAAFTHSEQAYRLATKDVGQVSRLVVLANTVSTLGLAGLNSNAKDVALEIAAAPSDCEGTEFVQLFNASNGIFASHAVEDEGAAAFFYKILSKKYDQNNRIVTALHRTYFDTAIAEYLCKQGKPAEAFRHLSAGLQRTRDCKNTRITANLLCAMANVYVMIGRKKQLAQYKSDLMRLLPLTKTMPLHHEEVLVALTQISDKGGDKKEFFQFSQALKSHLLTTRHRQFFETVAREFAIGESHRVQLRPVSQSSPSWLSEEIQVTNSESSPISIRRSSSHSEAEDNAEGGFRSSLYEVAEDWAVAAEFFTGGNPLDCFAVGEVSRLLALEQNAAPRTATFIGLATRLRGIGKIAMAQTSRHGSTAYCSWGRDQHQSGVGASLLSGTSDAVIELASQIARTQFEWWNGAGSPSGLRGEDIPFEARICAVAETFLQLVRPCSATAWPIDSALKQLSCMAGIQLDPKIVGSLTRLVGSSRSASVDTLMDVSPAVKNSGILQAKDSLFDILDLKSDATEIRSGA